MFAAWTHPEWSGNLFRRCNVPRKSEHSTVLNRVSWEIRGMDVDRLWTLYTRLHVMLRFGWETATSTDGTRYHNSHELLQWGVRRKYAAQLEEPQSYCNMHCCRYCFPFEMKGTRCSKSTASHC
jgi:hypothetical protein